MYNIAFRISDGLLGQILFLTSSSPGKDRAGMEMKKQVKAGETVWDQLPPAKATAQEALGTCRSEAGEPLGLKV